MAAVFSDLGKKPEASELVTICRRSLSTEVKTVFKKSDGIMSRVQVVDFRCRIKGKILYNNEQVRF